MTALSPHPIIAYISIPFIAAWLPALLYTCYTSLPLHYASNPVIIKDHFRKLGKVIQHHGIRPEGITNCDEKGFILGYSAKTKVLTRHGRKNPRVKQHGKRELLTAMEAVAANGYVYTPMIIAKGKTHRYGWYDNLREDMDMRFAYSPKGWTDNALGLWWLTNIYDPESRRQCPQGTRLLILDGHTSHVDYDFVEYAEENNIILFCLPPHSTHLLQPLDVGLFSPLQRYYSNALENWFLSTGQGINRSTFPPLYWVARNQAYTRKNILAAFAATGVVPLNHRVVIDKLQAPATLKPPAYHSEIPDLPQHSFPTGLTPYKPSDSRSRTQRALRCIDLVSKDQLRTFIVSLADQVEEAHAERELSEHAARRLREEYKLSTKARTDLRILETKARVLSTAEILKARAGKDAPKKPARRKVPARKPAPAPVIDLPTTPKHPTNLSTTPAAANPAAVPPSIAATPRRPRVRFAANSQAPPTPPRHHTRNRRPSRASPDDSDFSDTSSFHSATSNPPSPTPTPGPPPNRTLVMQLRPRTCPRP